MPIEIKELHIRVEVNEPKGENAAGTTGSPQHIFVDTSDNLWIGRDGTPDQLVLEMDTSQDKDHKNWVNVTSMNIGGHKPGGGAAGDHVPLEEVSFNYEKAEVQHVESGGDFLFQADPIVAGGGRDLLIGGFGADHLDAAASTNNRGLLIVGVDEVRLTAMSDGFDLV